MTTILELASSSVWTYSHLKYSVNYTPTGNSKIVFFHFTLGDAKEYKKEEDK